jgi:hypothetical protein
MKKLNGLFQKKKIVPVSISYEYDPTDALKMPQLMAEIIMKCMSRKERGFHDDS